VSAGRQARRPRSPATGCAWHLVTVADAGNVSEPRNSGSSSLTTTATTLGQIYKTRLMNQTDAKLHAVSDANRVQLPLAPDDGCTD